MASAYTEQIGWVHIVNMVTLEGRVKYMVDAASSGDGAMKPIPLVDGHAIQNIGTQQIRLMYDNILKQTDKSKKLCIYQYRNHPKSAWNSFHASPDTELLHADFERMSYFTSSSPHGPQTYTVLAVEFLRRESEIYEKFMLVDCDMKQNTGGKTALVKTCKTEEERVQVLKAMFRGTLTEEERTGIIGTVTEMLVN